MAQGQALDERTGKTPPIMTKTNRIPRRNLLLLLIQLAFVGVVLAGDPHTLETVSQVNLDRYIGRWYEMARLPNW